MYLSFLLEAEKTQIQCIYFQSKTEILSRNSKV